MSPFLWQKMEKTVQIFDEFLKKLLCHGMHSILKTEINK
jgi:hypothetical protein